MIIDVFHKRYPNACVFSDGLPTEVQSFLRQAAQIVFEDLGSHVTDLDGVCARAYGKLVRELGHGLCKADGAQETCAKALCEPYDLWNNAHGPAEVFLVWRLSLVELLMTEIQADLCRPVSKNAPGILRKLVSHVPEDSPIASEPFQKAVQELNMRMHQAGIPYAYHNGKIQRSTDGLTQTNVHAPFWQLVADPKWANVDTDMKEAIDRRDSNRCDVVVPALMALESAIKIISDEKGWTHGTERGAASYIDNLVSSANGRFIEPWEAEQLKGLFRDIRNPHGHGPGSAPQPQLSKAQENWVIDSAMIWVKSLITRL